MKAIKDWPKCGYCHGKGCQMCDWFGISYNNRPKDQHTTLIIIVVVIILGLLATL